MWPAWQDFISKNLGNKIFSDQVKSLGDAVINTLLIKGCDIVASVHGCSQNDSECSSFVSPAKLRITSTPPTTLIQASPLWTPAGVRPLIALCTIKQTWTSKRQRQTSEDVWHVYSDGLYSTHEIFLISPGDLGHSDMYGLEALICPVEVLRKRCSAR